MRGLQRRTLIRAGAGLLVAGACALGALAGLRSGGLRGSRGGVAEALAAWAAPTPGSPGRAPGVPRLPGASGDAGPASGAARRAGVWRARAAADAAGGTPGRGGSPDGLDPRAAREDRRIASGRGAIVLDGVQVPAGAVSGSLRGFDPEGPRALVLWRVDDRGSVRLADGFSDAEGNLHFPQVAEPGDPLTLVVAPKDAPPPSQEMSDPASTARSTPLAPVVAQVIATPGGVVLRVAARESTGAVLVATGSGALLGRFALPVAPGAAGRMLDIAVDGPVGGSGLLVAQELPDGRRSAFQPVTLPTAGGSGP